MKKLKILGLCGSLRKASTNMGLLRYVEELDSDQFSFQIADLSAVPFYNPDEKTKTPAVEKFMEQCGEADAFILACPEYNYSITPVLKNALDWLSREPKNCLLAGKTAAIVGAGGGKETARAQYHLRQICVYLDLHLVNKPEVFCNSFGGYFAEDGTLLNTKTQETLVLQLDALILLTAKLQG